MKNKSGGVTIRENVRIRVISKEQNDKEWWPYTISFLPSTTNSSRDTDQVFVDGSQTLNCGQLAFFVLEALIWWIWPGCLNSTQAGLCVQVHMHDTAVHPPAPTPESHNSYAKNDNQLEYLLTIFPSGITSEKQMDFYKKYSVILMSESPFI